MNSGMYSALSGNLAAMKQMDVLTNNLANAATNGYKQDRIVFDSLLAGNLKPPAVPEGQTADPVLLGDRMLTDHSPGSLRQTGNPLDLALQGNGFFAVTTPDGTAYTRQGSFRLAADGTLITANGYPVQSQNGQPIVISVVTQASADKPSIDSQGTITMNGEQMGTLGIFDFPRPYQLDKVAGTFFVPSGQGVVPQPAGPNTTVTQGALEESNVNAVSAMVQMIEASRYFETCQKVIRSYDEMAAKAANEIARV